MPDIRNILIGLATLAVACVAVAIVAYGKGYRSGQEDAQAKAQKHTNAALTDGLQQYQAAAAKHQELIDVSQAVSQQLRAAGDAAIQVNRSTTNDLRKLLGATSGQRADCRIDERIVQQLSAARDRAASAAAGAAPGSTDAGLRDAAAVPNK